MKIANLKPLHIFFFIFWILIVYGTMVNKKPNRQNVQKFEEELVQKEAWLESEIQNISKTLNYEPSYHMTGNRKVWFLAHYSSPIFHKDKSMALYSQLLQDNWIDATEQIDKKSYIYKTDSRDSVEAQENTRILCKNKATLFMYMMNMKDVAESNIYSEVGTLVEIEYSYGLPCYDFNDKGVG